ncbi:MAG: diguanylate cyclase [Reinekea sp.]|jgi:diguanylate cyclase (GGDEF)-like protein
MPNSFIQSSFSEQRHSRANPVADIAALCFDPPSAEAYKDFRLLLFSLMQTSLDIEHIIDTLHRQLKLIMPVTGIQYTNAERLIEHSAGHPARHRCQYQLTLKKEQFGDIIFLRSKRFSEQEMQFIESIMDIVIFPLRNALKYHDALATAMIDPLTGLNNRSAMAITLNREMERSRRNEGQDLSIVMIDIDYFKEINDRYGHLGGDDILRQVAHIIQSSIRGSDACFRFGGEEFLICVTNSNPPLARMVAERIRMTITENIQLPDKEKTVTASCGIAHYASESDWPELVSRADAALYAAKKQGRNRVVSSTTVSENGVTHA